MSIRDAAGPTQAQASARAGTGQQGEAQPAIKLGQDSLRIRRDGGRPVTREEWTRQFKEGFNRKSDPNELMAFWGLASAGVGAAMGGYALTAAAVSWAVPVIGLVLAIGGLTAAGVGIYRTVKARSK